MMTLKMKTQTKWRWGHAVYLFLGGLGAAAYVIGVICDLTGTAVNSPAWIGMAKIGIFSGFICVVVGMLVLFLDLGKPLNAFHAWKRPGTSWISRGFIILMIFMILAAINIGFWIWPFGSVLAKSTGPRFFIEILGLIFAFGVMTYTGFLLSANRSIAAWSTPIMPPIFLISALFTGTLLVQFFSGFMVSNADQPLKCLGYTALILGVIQILHLGFYLQGNHRTTEARESTMVLLKGEASALFWVGVVIIGLVIPIVLELAAVLGTGVGFYPIAGIAGLLGGLFLRQAILASGIIAPLRAARFVYMLPNT
ncbi:MAG: NrfD/PsrC family molybdoenzyme membrane anchor subunit [bacterium]